jgi:arylsulfatase I/J
VDPADQAAAAAALPPVDSLDMWPLLSGANATAPRDWVPICANASAVPSTVKLPFPLPRTSAVIVGDWKLVKGALILQSYRQGPQFPNATPYGEFLDPAQMQVCWPLGCLYDLSVDPGEQTDVATAHLAVVARLDARITEMIASSFGEPSDLSQNASCAAAIAANGNFYGPWLP